MDFSKSRSHNKPTDSNVAVYRSTRPTALLAIVLSVTQAVLCALGINLLLALTTVFALCVVYSLWVYRLSKNLSALHVRDLKFTPAWAVASFIIPILNLIRPYEVMTELWKASDPKVDLDDDLSWKGAIRGTIVTYWYILWLLFLAAGCAYLPYRFMIGYLPSTIYFLLASVAFLFNVVMIIAIKQLQVRQDKKWKRIVEIMPDSPAVFASKSTEHQKDWMLISIGTIFVCLCVVPTIMLCATLLRTPALLPYIMGDTQLNRNDYKAAIVHFDRAISLDPKYASAYVNRGWSYDNLGQLQEAVADYSKALSLDPKNAWAAWAYAHRGSAYENLGQHQKAVDDLNKATKLDPKYALAYYHRGIAYKSLGQHQKAIDDYSRVIELAPKFLGTYVNRGVAYDELGQHQKAINDYSHAISLDPKCATAYNNRGAAYGFLKQHQKALEDFNKAIGLDPKYAKAYKNRWATYLKLGQIDLADKDLQKAKELGYKPEQK
jgi:tetratricopeptide (TPR) repeat protein